MNGTPGNKTFRFRAALVAVAPAFFLFFFGIAIGATFSPPVRAETLDVKNPSFETVLPDGSSQDWRFDSAFFRIERGAARSGDAALRWDSTDSGAYKLAVQPISVAPGTYVEFSVWVKTNNVVDGGATACVEWSGRDGNWLGGAYATGVRGTRDDWTRVSGRGRVPENAASVSFSCYVEKTGTGTAWFDDAELKTWTPPFLQGIDSDAYRRATDGKRDLTIRVGVDTNLLKDGVSELTDPLVVSGDGLRDPLELAPKTFGDDYVEFAVPSQTLRETPPGNYVATYSTRNPLDGSPTSISTTFSRVESFPPRKTYIDEYRRAIVDGEPFFPLGLYFGDVKPDELEIFADSAFNCLMPYSPIRRETLDLCQEKKIRVVYSVKDDFPTLAVATAEEGVERTKKTVSELKDHPAIFAWYVNDELPLTMLDDLTARRDLLEELDPSRPTWAVLYQIGEIRGYLPTFDVVGTDPYPIPSQPVSTAADYSRRTNAATFQTRAVWQVPQIFNWASYKKGDDKKNGRAPTFDEMRAMAWSSVAAGANGLVFYSWFDLWRMNKTVDEGGAALVREPFEERWSDVKRMAAEIAEYIPTLLAVEPTLDVVRSDDGESPEIVSRLYGRDGATWALVVNVSETPRTIRLTAADAKSVELKLGGNIVSQENGSVEIELAPLEPAFAVFSR